MRERSRWFGRQHNEVGLSHGGLRPAVLRINYSPPPLPECTHAAKGHFSIAVPGGSVLKMLSGLGRSSVDWKKVGCDLFIQ